MLLVIVFGTLLGGLLALAVGVDANLPTTVLIVGVPLVASTCAAILALFSGRPRPEAPIYSDREASDVA